MMYRTRKISQCGIGAIVDTIIAHGYINRAYKAAGECNIQTHIDHPIITKKPCNCEWIVEEEQ